MSQIETVPYADIAKLLEYLLMLNYRDDDMLNLPLVSELERRQVEYKTNKSNELRIQV